MKVGILLMAGNWGFWLLQPLIPTFTHPAKKPIRLIPTTKLTCFQLYSQNKQPIK